MPRFGTIACPALSMIVVACGFTLTSSFTAPAEAQVIDTEYMLPFPDGTNIVELSGAYGHGTNFHFTNGQTIPKSSTDEYEAEFRYARYIDIGGHPAGVQIYQSAGYTGNLQFNGVSTNGDGVRTLGASNTTLSAFFWPYANEEPKAYIFTAGYVTPPDGSYYPSRATNPAYGGWQGDAQVGGVKGLTPEISLQAAFDIQLHGNESIGNGAHLGVDPNYRLQVWAVYEWSEAVATSIGYTGVFGGAATTYGPGYSFSNNSNAERQQLRAEATYWWNTHVMTSLELAHDVQTGSDFQSVIDAEAKVKLRF